MERQTVVLVAVESREPLLEILWEQRAAERELFADSLSLVNSTNRRENPSEKAAAHRVLCKRLVSCGGATGNRVALPWIRQRTRCVVIGGVDIIRATPPIRDL